MAARLRTLPLLALALAVLISPIIIAANSSASPATQAAHSPSGGSSNRTITVVAAENFWGSIAQPDRRHARPRDRASSPTRTPIRTATSRPRSTPARSPGAQLVIENGIGYDPWAARLLAADQGGGQTVLNVGDARRRGRRRQPAPLVQPGRRAAWSSASWSPTSASSIRPTGLLRQPATPLRHRRVCGVRRADHRDQGEVRRHAGRRVRVDLRDAGARARPRADHAPLVPARRSARAPTSPRPTSRRSTTRSGTT